MKHTTGLTVLILAAGLFFSCTEGDYEGSGGAGNLNIIDRSSLGTLNGKYVSVEGVKTGVKVGFDPSTPRQRVSEGKVSAPLYNYLTTGDKYTGDDIFSSSEFTIWIYDHRTAPQPDTSLTKTFAVTFYAGSGLIEWE